ncbi:MULTISPECIES: DUF3299 domain-containing protein [unclassified Rhizobium]|nr:MULTISPECIES: DUF3299 domain-containing protein [unclassified Rhizobium]MBB3399349.1 hypothetical protein [Rhizobium sp. BK060]MBB4166630.1 hypothetical protein [Rhizobium sp. BK538]
MDQRGALLPPSESVPDEVVAKSLTWPINGPAVELTGFLLPIDQEGELVYEFMLVPWAGACSHGAAPPPNQMVHVFPAQPYRISRIYEPIVVSGRLKPGIDQAQLFIMDGRRVLTYGYSMTKADVVAANKLDDPDLRAIPPGNFLSK